MIITNSIPSGGSDFFQSTYDDMQIELSNERGKRRGSKDCIMEFDVELPEGYTIGTLRLNANGAMELPAHASGTAEVIVSIPGLTNRPWNNSKSVQVAKVGPFDEDYDETFKLDFGSQPGQLCPSKVKVYVDVLAWGSIGKRAAADAEALVTVDQTSGLFTGSGYPLIGLVACKKDKPWWWWY